MQKPLAIIGPQGSGKTRLIHAIAQLIAEEYHEVHWHEISSMRKEASLHELTSADVLVVNVSTPEKLRDAELYLRGLRDGDQAETVIIFHCQFQERVANSDVVTYYTKEDQFPKRND